jgi:excinuclease ABC subunit C
MILKGKTEEILKKLEEDMKSLSNSQDFEKAIKIREQINSIKYLREKQNMERQKEYNEDIINYVIKENKVYLMIFNIYKGILENKKDFEFSYNPNFFEEFLVQYYSENSIPKELILPEAIDESIIKFLEKIGGKKIVVIVPQKGEKKELLDLVLKNIKIHFFGDIERLKDLQNRLNLEEIPEVIECFDISHLSGTSSVGSMVQFRNAKPDKSNYRRFKIKTVDGIDDFKAVAEVVRRRYYRLVLEKSQLPNLIVIDGGIGQLNYAMKSLKELGIKVPIISIAKREEEIYVPNKAKPIKLDKKNKGLLLLIAIRDEAHRFAIKYNRLLRGKSMLEKN